MTENRNEIYFAFRRVAVLKTIISKERERAEAKPIDKRNIDLGLIRQDSSITEARLQLKEIFNDLQLLLDHLHISYMAASFELEANRRLAKALGEARTAITDARHKKDLWPIKLLRESKSFEGLRDIEKLLTMSSLEQSDFAEIRKARNDFNHGVLLNRIPTIDPRATLGLLSSMLDSIK